MTLAPSALAAALAGLVASGHCFGMCGPLACAAAGARPGARASISAALAWQLARLAAYAIAGALAGGLGARASGLLKLTTSPLLPWAMAAVLVATAFSWSDHLPPVPFLDRARRPLVQLGAKFAPPVRAGAIGALTPLLPCGMFYAALGAAAVAGSMARGALVTVSFGLGAVPALGLAQAQSAWTSRVPARWGAGLRRGVALLAAGVLVWRAVHSGSPGGSPS